MSVNRDKIIKFCEDYLEVKKFTDFCHNGLQIEGAKEIDKIVIGVSFSESLIKEAIKRKAQMIIVHHGLFIKHFDGAPQFKGYLKNRLKQAFCNDLNLAGFHLPLDAHPVIGNNISLCNLLGIKKTASFDVGFIGELPAVRNFPDFLKTINKKLNTDSFYIAAGPKKIKRIGVISGGASPDFVKAAELGADTYICGDVRESIVRAVEETKINFINAGHYNTEKLGIMNLGNLITKKFKIKVEFTDIPCEI